MMNRTGGKSRKKSRAQARKGRSAPVAQTKQNRTRAPQISSLPSGGCRIRHREYFSDLAGSVAFSVQEFAANPGLGRTFPWLSKLASRYESYHFESLKFSFETEAPTSATGVVALMVDYDPTDPAPLSKTAALSYEGAVRAAPWDDCTFVARRSDLSKRKSYFVRCGNVVAEASISLHDVGNLFVVTKGQADGSTVGELYVDYTVVLETPQTDPASLSAKIVAGGTISKAVIYGDAPTNTGCLDVTASSSTLTFNQSAQVLAQWTVTGTGLTTAPVVTGTATSGIGSANVDGTGASLTYSRLVRAEPGETLILDFSAMTSVTACVVRFAEYQYTLG